MALARLSGFNVSASVTVTAASSELNKELIHTDPVVNLVQTLGFLLITSHDMLILWLFLHKLQDHISISNVGY